MSVEPSRHAVWRKQLESAIVLMNGGQYFKAGLVLLIVAKELLALHAGDHGCDGL